MTKQPKSAKPEKAEKVVKVPGAHVPGKAPRQELPGFQKYYNERIVPEMMKKFSYKNPLAVPRLKKIVVNMGVGKGAEDIKIVEQAQGELSMITGQHAVITRAKKAISNFKIRENSPVGCRVTLRRRVMYEFLERLIRVALPRIRDFRGLSPRGFDQAGNYSFGIHEQNIFPEVETDRVIRPQGMDVIIVMNAGSRDKAYHLLTLFGFPFRTKMEKAQAEPKPQEAAAQA